MMSGLDYNRQAVVWGMAPWSISRFSGALVLANAIVHVYHFWSWLGGSLVQHEPPNVLGLEPSLEGLLCKPMSVAAELSLGPLGKSYKVVSFVATSVVIEGTWERCSLNQSWLPLVPGLRHFDGQYHISCHQYFQAYKHLV